MNQEKIGTYINSLRKTKGLSQEQLAERFNVSSRTISRWETGRTLPDITTIIELAAFYEVDILEILNGENNIAITDRETADTAREIVEYAAEHNLSKTDVALQSLEKFLSKKE